LKKNLKDNFVYSLLHTKYLLFDNLYVLIPLIRHQNNKKQILQKCLKNVLQLIITMSENKEFQTFKLNEINMNAMFNDQSLLKDLLISFIQLLVEYENFDSENGEALDEKRSRFFKKLLDLFENNL
jgi:hypothetical protein